MTKTRKLEIQLENLKIALWRWRSIPDENIVSNLMNWQEFDPRLRATQIPTCNTIACFGGWVALMPEFREMGVKVSEGGSPYMRRGGHVVYFDWCVADHLFGDSRLFQPKTVTEQLLRESDRQVVIHRIKRRIKEIKKELKGESTCR
jgi:hypothetical protein